ncbi:hypothetical protein Ddye_009292 [Dipteronia dyeriana]|uniref:Uncharacterized protein n=1 Tax=Dipteronia dyeriana TaxID=168575 RepID=A0AAD9XBB6_9ROSI|nr:hypothetical protein Ddye_009292 [Dipteronia dyeriana]
MSCDGRRARSEKVRMQKSDVRRLDMRQGRLLMVGRGVEEIEKLKLGKREICGKRWVRSEVRTEQRKDKKR